MAQKIDHQIDGYVHPDFYPVAQALKRQLKNEEGGAAVAVWHEGRCVVDLWGGYKNEAHDSWESDTMSVSFSTTKGVASTALHVCADRGLIRYDDPVCKYWPEFAQNGKEQITVRHVLSHQAGLYNIRKLIADAAQMLDWEFMVDVLAKARPEHEPGAMHAYHGLTYGYLVGELVRRVTGSHIRDFIQEELAIPLGLDGLYIGAPEDVIHRAAQLIRPHGKRGGERGIGAGTKRGESKKLVSRAALVQRVLRTVGVPIDLKKTGGALMPKGIGRFDFSSPEVLKASIPAANGLFTARSLAKLYAALAAGGSLEGVKLVSPDTLAEATKVQSKKVDRVVPVPMQWRLGYHMAGTTRGIPKTAFGHYGFGGSGAWAHPKRNLSFAMILNSGVGTPFGDLRTARMSGAVLGCAMKRD